MTEIIQNRNSSATWLKDDIVKVENDWIIDVL